MGYDGVVDLVMVKEMANGMVNEYCIQRRPCKEKGGYCYEEDVVMELEECEKEKKRGCRIRGRLLIEN